jgi:hypothetical protein
MGRAGRGPNLRAALPYLGGFGLMVRVHLTFEECERRYPRLVNNLQWVLIGSSSEAACCLRDYRDGLRWGGEAVSHSGLSPADRVKMAVSYHVRLACREQRARTAARP